MKVALIPPLGWERYLEQSTGIQMSLSLDHLMINPFYLEAFQRAKAGGCYVILDNGANERRRTSHKALMEAAGYVRASEVVLPDKLGDGERTWLLTQEFFKSQFYVDGLYGYMLPIHGATAPQLTAAVDRAARDSRITTLGLPRILLQIHKASIRIDFANWIEHNYPKRFKVHLLGASPAWIMEVRYAAKYAPSIRSIDTSLPFNYALANYRLHDKLNVVVDRPDNYWDNIPLSDLILTQDNIATFKAWAQGE